MDASLHATLAGWANFYLITGTAAAALTGLQFVVQTLIAGERERAIGGDDPEEGISAFGTGVVLGHRLSAPFFVVGVATPRSSASASTTHGIPSPT